VVLIDEVYEFLLVAII